MAKSGAAGVLFAALYIIVGSFPVRADRPAASPPAARHGPKDFDRELGTLTTHVKVPRNPLSGAAPDWAEYQGISVVKPLLGGLANLVAALPHSQISR